MIELFGMSTGGHVTHRQTTISECECEHIAHATAMLKEDDSIDQVVIVQTAVKVDSQTNVIKVEAIVLRVVKRPKCEPTTERQSCLNS